MQCIRQICKMYVSSVSGHIVDCSEYIFVLYLYMNNLPIWPICHI